MPPHANASVVSIAQAAAALRAGTRTSLDLVEASLHAIDARGAETRAFIRVDAAAARQAACEADAELGRGVDRGPLHGIPVSVKDLIDIAGQPTTAASRVLGDAVAQADAPVVSRLREAGAVILGKTNLHEFALGTTSEDSAFGAVRHPNDLTRSAGGSSGGSAVAVATGMGLASVGTDTGGSIRIPSSCCGVVGLKPSHGEVSTAGVVPLSATLDHVGPLARTVQDATWLWAVLAGRTTTNLEDRSPKTVRLRHLNGYFGLMASDVRLAFDHALAALTTAGVSLVPGALEGAEAITQTYVNIALPEVARWHAPYLDTRGSSYTPAVRARLESGRTIPAVDYLTAREAQVALHRAVDDALEGVDALLLPTLPITPPLLGASDAMGPWPGGTIPVRAAMLRNTQLFNLTGHPALSLPIATAGLPVGLQLVGPLHKTLGLLAIAAACEKIVYPG